MPRTKKGVFVADKVDFHFHCMSDVDARYGRLLQYLKSKTKLQQIEMLLQASEAFWMPFAHRYHKDLEARELEQAVDKTIYQLRVQILNLEESFGAKYTVEDNDSPTKTLPISDHPSNQTTRLRQGSAQDSGAAPNDQAQGPLS